MGRSLNRTPDNRVQTVVAIGAGWEVVGDGRYLELQWRNECLGENVAGGGKYGYSEGAVAAACAPGLLALLALLAPLALVETRLVEAGSRN